MSAGAISGASGGAALSGTSFGEMASEDFIKVMISELSNQDPFEPQDSSALLEQLSSLRNIESQLSLQQSIETLVMQSQVSAAGTLIGRWVSGINASDQRIEGQVTAVRVSGNQVQLELDSGRTLPMTKVERVTDTP